MADYAVKRIDEMEAIYGGGFKRARAELGVTAFGMQVMDLPPNLDQYPEHDHGEDGQEEVYVVLEGSGRLAADGQTWDLVPGTLARVGAGQKRTITPGPGGATILALGGTPGKAYEPPKRKA